MTVAISPLRVSFAGGGTDIEPYLSTYGGCCLASAIKIYAKAIYPSKVIPSEIENTITDFLGAKERLQITQGTPPMSGLGGSASCFVAGIKAVAPELNKEEIAKLAFHLERRVMNVAGGKQDQYAAAFGGMMLLEFVGDSVGLEQIDPPQTLEKLLVIVHVGKRNKAGADVIKDQMDRMNLDSFHRQKGIARNMKQCLIHNDLVNFGKLLHEAWQAKQGYTPLMTTEKIKDFYKDCLKWGAIGGKLTGAGGGGYMLLMEHPEKQRELKENLTNRLIPYIQIQFDTEGVREIDKRSG